MVRLVRAFRELGILVDGVICSFQTLGWTLLLLAKVEKRADKASRPLSPAGHPTTCREHAAGRSYRIFRRVLAAFD